MEVAYAYIIFGCIVTFNIMYGFNGERFVVSFGLMTFDVDVVNAELPTFSSFCRNRCINVIVIVGGIVGANYDTFLHGHQVCDYTAVVTIASNCL